VAHGDGGGAVLADSGAAHLPAERPRHRLEAVADPEHGHAGLEEGGIDGGGAVGVHGRGPPGEDDRRRLAPEHLGQRHRVGHDLGVHARLTHAAGDELGVLGAEVDDEDGAVAGHAAPPAAASRSARSRRAGRSAANQCRARASITKDSTGTTPPRMRTRSRVRDQRMKDQSWNTVTA